MKTVKQRAAAWRMKWKQMRQTLRRTVLAARRNGFSRRDGLPHNPQPSLQRHWERMVRSLLRFRRASVGNAVELFSDGDDAMEALWESIASARHSVWMEMYHIEPDRVGLRTIEELTAAAKRGCTVLLIIDALGSSHLTEAALAPLREAGADRVVIQVFNPIRPWRWPARRDHRKIIIVDGKVGFCGGMNLSEEYAGTRHGNGRFHDSMVRMHGPCVRDLAAVFANSWKTMTRNKRKLPRRSKHIGEAFVQVQKSSGLFGRRSIQRALRLTIRNAATHCFISTPYFIPPLRLVHAIKRAAERGVDVRILTAGVSDVPSVRLAAQHIYGDLLKHNVRIFEMTRSTLHAKTITIDGVYGSVGSFNLDTWSDKRNLECNVAIIDPAIAQQMQDLFLKNIEEGCEVMLETWHKRTFWQRAVQWLAYHILRL